MDNNRRDIAEKRIGELEDRTEENSHKETDIQKDGKIKKKEKKTQKTGYTVKIHAIEVSKKRK